jgi:hypothetical protein
MRIEHYPGDGELPSLGCGWLLRLQGLPRPRDSERDREQPKPENAHRLHRPDVGE